METTIETEPQHKPAAPARTKFQRLVVTGAMATEMLKNNTANRPTSRREVERLKRVLESGEWRFNGEAIKFSRSGKILDGQHRLAAIAETGISADVVIISGLEDEIFPTLDQGRKRTGGDVLYIRGVKHYNAVGTACATFYRLMKNKPIHGGVDPIPPPAIDEIFKRHPGINDAVQLCDGLAKQGSAVVGIGHIAAFYYLMQTVFGLPQKALSFAEGITIGAGLDEKSPILSFRKRVFEARARRNMMQTQAKLALLAKVAGMHLSDRVVKALTQPSTAATYDQLIPGLTEAIGRLDDKLALRDMQN